MFYAQQICQFFWKFKSQMLVCNSISRICSAAQLYFIQKFNSHFQIYYYSHFTDMHERLIQVYGSQVEEPKVHVHTSVPQYPQELIPKSNPLRRPSQDRSLDRRSSPLNIHNENRLNRNNHQPSISIHITQQHHMSHPSTQQYLNNLYARETVTSERLASEIQIGGGSHQTIAAQKNSKILVPTKTNFGPAGNEPKGYSKDYMDKLDKVVQEMTHLEQENKRLVAENSTLWEDLQRLRTTSTQQSMFEIDEIIKNKEVIIEKDRIIAQLNKKIENMESAVRSSELEYKANMILSNQMLELTRMVVHLDNDECGDVSEREVNFEELRNRIASIIENNKQYRREIERTDSLIRENQHHCNQQLQGVINKLNEIVFQKNELELKFFDVKQENITLNQSLAEVRKYNKSLNDKIQALERNLTDSKINSLKIKEEESLRQQEKGFEFQAARAKLTARIDSLVQEGQKYQAHIRMLEEENKILVGKLKNMQHLTGDFNRQYEQKIKLLEEQYVQEKNKNENILKELYQLEEIKRNLEKDIQEVCKRNYELNQAHQQESRQREAAVKHIQNLESLLTAKHSELENLHRQHTQTVVTLEETSREAKIRDAQIESFKRSYNMQLETLQNVKKNLLQEVDKAHADRLAVEERLRQLQLQQVETSTKAKMAEKVSSQVTRLSQLHQMQTEEIERLRRTLEDHIGHINELNGLVQQKEVQVNRLSHELMEASQKLHDSQIKMTETRLVLERTEQSYKSTIEELNKTVSLLRVEAQSRSHLEIELEQSTRKIQELKTTLEQQSIETSRISSSVRSEAETKSRLQKSLDQSQRKITDLEKALERKLLDFENEKNNILMDLAHKENRILNLQATIKNHEEIERVKELEKTQILRELEKKSEEIKNLQETLKNSNNYKSEYESLKQQVYKLTSQQQHLNIKIQHYEKQISTLEKHKLTLEKQLLQQNTHFQEGLLKMKREAEIVRNTEQVAHYQSIIRNLEGRQRMLEEQIESKAKMMLQSEERVKQYMTMVQEMKDQLKKLNRVVEQKDAETRKYRLQAEQEKFALISKHDQEVLKYQRQILKKQVEIPKPQHSVEESVMRSRQEVSTSERLASEQRILDLTLKVRETEQKLFQAESKLRTLQETQTVQYEISLKTSLNTIKELENKNQYHIQQIKSLKTRLQETNRELGNVKAELKKSEPMKRQLESQGQTTRENEDLQKTLKLNRKIEELEKELSSLRSFKLTEINKSIDTPQLRSDIKESQERQSQRETQLQEQVRMLKDIGFNLEKENSELIAKVKSLELISIELRNEIRVLREERTVSKASTNNINTTIMNTTIQEDNKKLFDSTINQSIMTANNNNSNSLRPFSQLPNKSLSPHRIIQSQLFFPSSHTLKNNHQQHINTLPNNTQVQENKTLQRQKSEDIRLFQIPGVNNNTPQNLINSPRVTSSIPRNTFFENILKNEPAEQVMMTLKYNPNVITNPNQQQLNFSNNHSTTSTRSPHRNNSLSAGVIIPSNQSAQLNSPRISVPMNMPQPPIYSPNSALNDSNKIVRMTRISRPEILQEKPNSAVVNLDLKKREVVNYNSNPYLNNLPLSPTSGLVHNRVVNIVYDQKSKFLNTSQQKNSKEDSKKSLFDQQAYFGNAETRKRATEASMSIEGRISTNQFRNSNAGYLIPPVGSNNRPTSKIQPALFNTFGTPQESASLKVVNHNTQSHSVMSGEELGMRVYQAEDLKNQDCC